MNNRIYRYSELSGAELKPLLSRPKIDFSQVFGIVEPIIDDVRRNGDAALRAYTLKFDNVQTDDLIIDIPPPDEIELPAKVKSAFNIAGNNIRMFHLAQVTPHLRVETIAGVKCSRQSRPIERVGLYVPGGTAVLPSTVLMLAIPAALAGCREIILCTPPGKNATVSSEVLYAASIAGISKVLLAGGAQAVAALAYGTESVPKVDKILGPGNQYVTAAKMLLQNSEAMISIDMPAGPSEVLVIADKTAKPAYVAADMLSQAEHGADSQSVLVLSGLDSARPYTDEITRQLSELPRRDITEKAIQNSFVMMTDTLDEALAFSNLYAPEHLILNIEHADRYTSNIMNAGSVFVGPWSPESVGDYASGTNHTLPTYGYARMYSGVSLDSFLKQITFQELTPEGLMAIGPHVEVMAETEGLTAHKNAVTLRLRDIT
ncbi:MAG: histidinol dehydrogenase [Cyclonatronaceae bacterium]